MAARLVKFEDDGDRVLAYDDQGQVFVTPRGRWDWQPLVEPPPVAPAEPELERPPAGRRRRWRS